MSNQYTKIKNQLDNVVDDIECCLIDGMSVGEISDFFGYGYSSVYNCIIRNGLNHYVSVKNIGKGRRYDAYNIEYNKNHKLTRDVLFKLYWVDLLDMYEIADMFNVSASGILYRMRKYDIPSRNKSDAAKLLYKKNPGLREIHRKNANNGITGIFRKGNNYKNTNIEKMFEDYCIFENIVYNKQFQIYPGGHRYDFLVNSNILVELDGSYWHDRDNQRIKDDNHDNEARLNGYIIFRFSDLIIKETNGGCFNVIKRYV